MENQKSISRVIFTLESLIPFINWLSIVGMVIFVAMVCLTFLDVILRYIFNRPFAGSIEITELMMVIVVFTGISVTQLEKAHVTVDIITSKLKSGPKLVMSGFSNILSIAILVVIIIQTFKYAITAREGTFVFHIPVNGFFGLVTIGCVLLVLVLVRDLLKDILSSLSLKKSILILLFGIPILVLFLSIYFGIGRPIALSPPTAGLMGIILMLIFFVTGMPIAFILMGIGFILVSYMRGSDASLNLIATSWYRTVASYPWSPLMFFILMGFLCFHAGLGRDLFEISRNWIGHLRGGLAMASVAACAGFGAVVGDTLSGTIAMAAIGLPEMKRYNYKDILSIGTITCSGTLGTLIPPSLGFIIYANLTEQSIGRLFIAGIIPGIICALLMMGLIYVLCRIDPNLGPPASKVTWKEKFLSLKSSGPVAGLFLLVIGGMYIGIFTANEGGGIGAFGALFLGLAMRRLNWNGFKSALVNSAKFIAMCFTLLGGANMFGYAVTTSNLPNMMANFVNSLDISPLGVMWIIILILLILGCFIPSIPMLVICIPVFLPIARLFEWNLGWFGVIMVLMLNLACVTPPFGINLFVIKGLTDKTMGFIYLSALPFVIALIITVAIVVIFPSISLWLPDLIKF